MAEQMCACGQPLHYTDPMVEKYVTDIVEKIGEKITVSVGDRGWLVPRHYIALHGIKGSEVEEAAKKYGFEEVVKNN